MEDIDHYNIPVYNFPYDIEEDDEDTIADNSELRVSLFSSCARAPRHHNPLDSRVDSLARHYFLSPSSGPKKRLKLVVNSFVRVVTHGVSSKSTTPSIQISVVYVQLYSIPILPTSKKSRMTFCMRIIERRNYRGRRITGTSTVRIAVSYPRIWRLRVFD